MFMKIHIFWRGSSTSLITFDFCTKYGKFLLVGSSAFWPSHLFPLDRSTQLDISLAPLLPFWATKVPLPSSPRINPTPLNSPFDPLTCSFWTKVHHWTCLLHPCCIIMRYPAAPSYAQSMKPYPTPQQLCRGAQLTPSFFPKNKTPSLSNPLPTHTSVPSGQKYPAGHIACTRDANLLTQKIRLITLKKSDFPHKNRIFTKKNHNFFHLRMLAQRHDSNSYS